MSFYKSTSGRNSRPPVECRACGMAWDVLAAGLAGAASMDHAWHVLSCRCSRTVEADAGLAR